MKKFMIAIEGYSPYIDDYIYDLDMVEAETEEEAKRKRMDLFCDEYDLVVADCEIKMITRIGD